MRRFVSVVVVVVVLLLVGGAIYVAWSLNQPAAIGPFTRIAEPQVLWGGGEVDVGLSFSPVTLPSCAPIKRSADVVLVIDQSGSMDGVPFQQAVAAADTFVQTVDLSVNRVGVLFFNDNATVTQPLTNDLATLQGTLRAQQAGGGTEVDKALRAAQGLLFGPDTRPDANSVLILLSDGGASDPNAAMNAGETLKQGGVRIVTLALSPDGQERAFMRSLASRDSDAYDNPDDLTTIYRSLAEQINTGVAFNVRIQETLNTDSFDLISDSVEPAAQLNEATINWAVASLPEGGSMFRYRLTTKGFGLRTISESQIEPEAALKDCEGGTPLWTLPNGPEVLILPPLWLCLPLLLLPLLLFGFWNWFRRREPAPRPQPTTPRSQEPVVAADETPAWLKKLTDDKILPSGGGPTESSRLQDTLLIGCGPAGREVLLQMAQVLRSRFGSQPPSNVGLMQIDIELQGSDSSLAALPKELQPFIQHVVLRPNLHEVESNLQYNPDDWAHWAWYKDADKERAQGRMALFYDLRNGNTNSELWSALNKVLGNLQSPRVRLIGTTFDETASGMLVDLARLTQVVTNRPSDVEFWLAGPVGMDWSSSLENARQLVRMDDQQMRTLATLREVERFQRNTRMPFVYVPSSSGQSKLRESAGGVVQTLFLFQSKEERSSVAPENDVFVCMAESLLALLHPEVNSALIQHLSSNRARSAGPKINYEGVGMACAIGSYAFRLPGQALTDALTWRFVHDLLYDASIGLVPTDHCQSDGRFRSLSEDDREDLINNTQLRQAAERFVNGFVNRSEDIGSFAFTVKLREELDQILNGDGSATERSNSLQKAQVWLKYVRTLVLRNRQQGVARQIDHLGEELAAWEGWLSGQVYALNQQRWQEARAELERLRAQRARNWLVDDELEWPLYQDKIRPWLRAPRGSDNQPLLYASQRFGWEVQTDAEGDGWKINLLVPPPDFIWKGRRMAVKPYVIKRTDAADSFLLHLAQIAQHFTRLKNDAELVLAKAELQNSKQWLELAEARLQYNKTEAAHQMGGISEGAILVGPRSSQIKAMQDRLNRVQALRVSTAETDDNSAVTLLQFVDWVPLSTITGLYDREAWQNNRPHSQLYVWQAEQVAAKMERNDQAYSAIFRGWLALDEKVVNLFARSYLYDAYQATQQGLLLPGVGSVSGRSVGSILQQLVEKPPATLTRQREQVLATWERAIAEEEQKKTQNGKPAYFKQVRGKKITPLLKSRRVEDRDFAHYLVYLMSQH